MVELLSSCGAHNLLERSISKKKANIEIKGIGGTVKSTIKKLNYRITNQDYLPEIYPCYNDAQNIASLLYYFIKGDIDKFMNNSRLNTISVTLGIKPIDETEGEAAPTTT